MLLWTIVPLLFVAAGNLNRHASVYETVDLIELNHFHDEQGRRVYDQVIFYGWSETQNRFLVRAWCLIERDELFARRPAVSHADGRTHVQWFDLEQKMERHIASRQFRETWTQTDPERANKQILDERDRTALYQRPKPEPLPDAPAPPRALAAIDSDAGIR